MARDDARMTPWMVKAFAIVGLVAVPLVATATDAMAGSRLQELLFRTPSSNILCAADSWDSRTNGSILCAVVSTATRTQYPITWGLPADGRVWRARRSDAPGNLGSGRVIPYGTTWTLGLFRCSSQSVGLRCWSRVTSHGFFLSRARQRVF
jgi:hypothetical protein